MNLLVDETHKIVELWLTNAEQQDPAFAAHVEQLCAEWHEKKYRAVVFCSGKRELYGLTEGLLLHNRTAAAHRELEEGPR